MTPTVRVLRVASHAHLGLLPLQLFPKQAQFHGTEIGNLIGHWAFEHETMKTCIGIGESEVIYYVKI